MSSQDFSYMGGAKYNSLNLTQNNKTTYNVIQTSLRQHFQYIMPAPYYIKLDYLQATGSQGIRTGYIPNPKTDKIEYIFQNTNTGTDHNLWCSRGAKAEEHTWTAFFIPNQGLRFDQNTTLTQTSYGTLGNTTYKVVMDKNLCYVNGTQVLAFPETDYTCINELVLMYKYIEDPTVTDTSKCGAYAYQKLYQVRIWSNNTLVRNFIPVIRVTDTEVGLFDTVHNCFYPNCRNNNNFIAGPKSYIEIDKHHYDFYRDSNGYFAFTTNS